MYFFFSINFVWVFAVVQRSQQWPSALWENSTIFTCLFIFASTFLLCAFSSFFKRYVDSSWQLWNRSLISALLSSAQTAAVLAVNNAKDSKTSCIVCITSVGSTLHSFLRNLLRLQWHQMWWVLQPHLIGQFYQHFHLK